MGFLKALFGGKEESPEERKAAEEAKKFDVLKYDGVRALYANQVDYAIECLTMALDIRDDAEAKDYLSQAYMRVGRLSEAVERLRELAAERPDNPLIQLRLAQVAYMMDDYEAMAEACEAALEIEENGADALFLLAKARLGQGDDTGALELLTKIVTLYEEHGGACLLRGETLLRLERTDEAGEDADRLLAMAPDNEDVLMLKARVERARGNNAEAIDYYNKVTDVNPFRVEAYVERAEQRLAEGDEAGAREDADKASELIKEQNA